MTNKSVLKSGTYFKPLACISLAFVMSAFANISAADSNRAIQLKDVQGKVMVNTGSGYMAGNNGMVLKPGYKVMLADKAQAKILYADNCSQTLKSNTLIKVPSANECNSNMFDEKSFTKTAALGDVPVVQTPAINSAILVWSAALGVTVGTSNSSNSNSNQSPDASAR